MEPYPNTYEVVIVGAGIMGSATAYYLSKHFSSPSKVLLLEQFDFLHRRGSSHGESRTIRVTYVEEHYTALTRQAFHLWREAETEAQTTLLTMTGGIDFCEPDSAMLNGLLKSLKNQNVPHELLGPAEVTKRFPVMKIPKGYVALYCPETGMIRATKAVATFQSLAVRYGCDLRDNSAVTEVIQLGPLLKIVTSSGKEYITKKCVIVAGPWTRKLLKKCFNVEVPLEQIQGTIAYWKVEDPRPFSASVLPVFNSYHEPQAYGTPVLEYPNLIKCCPYSGPFCDPDTRTFQPQQDLIERRAKAFLQKYFTGVELNPMMTETCLYTASPDEEYIIDTIPSHPNVVIGCGFSGHGFKLAPIVGKILTELATTGQMLYPDVQKHFALSRFS